MSPAPVPPSAAPPPPTSARPLARARRWLSRRLAEGVGLGLMLGAVGLVAAQLGAHPHDPSWNVAGPGPTHNPMGPPGAWAADLGLTLYGRGAWVAGPAAYLVGLLGLARHLGVAAQLAAGLGSLFLAPALAAVGLTWASAGLPGSLPAGLVGLALPSPAALVASAGWRQGSSLAAVLAVGAVAWRLRALWWLPAPLVGRLRRASQPLGAVARPR